MGDTPGGGNTRSRGRSRRPDRLGVSVAAAAVLAVALAGLVGVSREPSASTSRPSTTTAAASPSTDAVGGGATASPPASPSTSAIPTPRPTTATPANASASPSPASPSLAPTPASPPSARVALVPVVAFWSVVDSITTADLRAALAGRHPKFPTVVVGREQLPGLAEHLGVTPAPVVQVRPSHEVAHAVRGRMEALGVLPAGFVTPDVRALSVDGRSLFGAAHVTTLGDWPLVVPAAAPIRPDHDPDHIWTLVAGGDVMLDREVFRATRGRPDGPDLPWDGGTARITGTRCCNSFGTRIPIPERTGRARTLRELFRGADIGMVNLEGPAPDRFSYHPRGLTFTFDPALLTGLRNAGIDYASLGNNHIGNAGDEGIRDTVRHLDELAIGHAGAGDDLAAARRPAMYEAGGMQVAVLAYDDVNAGYHATRRSPGSAPLHPALFRSDVAAAREAGADVVVVWPHWGRQYTPEPTDRQRRLARQLVEAGADLVIGNHAHQAAAMEEIDGKVVFYALGDLVFDEVQSLEVMTGLVVEATFAGNRLLQIRLHPTILVDQVQPNLLEPEDAREVRERVRRASEGLLGW